MLRNSSGNASDGAGAAAQLIASSALLRERNLPSPQHALPRRAAFAVGDIDQSAYPAQERILERVDRTIGIDDFPEQLHELDPLLEREAVVDDAGETEELGRPFGGLL